jgi:hypothetical protein
MAERTLILPVYVRVAGTQVDIGRLTATGSDHEVTINPAGLELLDQVIASVHHEHEGGPDAAA